MKRPRIFTVVIRHGQSMSSWSCCERMALRKLSTLDQYPDRAIILNLMPIC